MYPHRSNPYQGPSGANAIIPLSQGNQSGYQNSSSGGTGPAPFHSCCPKLLNSKLKLLNEHKGCRKCRRFYVSHTKVNCPNDWPNASSYCTLTLEMALAVVASVSSPENMILIPIRAHVRISQHH